MYDKLNMKKAIADTSELRIFVYEISVEVIPPYITFPLCFQMWINQTEWNLANLCDQLEWLQLWAQVGSTKTNNRIVIRGGFILIAENIGA